MTDFLLCDFHDLFKLPIEQLAVSPTILKTLKWHGIISIADCLLCYTRDAHGRGPWPMTKAHWTDVW
jgi:hypothetical protein